MFLFEGAQLAHEVVPFGVTHGWGVEHVVAVVVEADLGAEFLDACNRVGHRWERTRGV